MNKALQTEYKNHPITDYLGAVKPPSKRTMFSALKTLGALVMNTETYEVMIDDLIALPWSKMTGAKAEALVSMAIEKGYSSSQINKVLVALRGVMKHAQRREWIDLETLFHINEVKSETVSREDTGRELTTLDKAKLEDVCLNDKSEIAGARDLAILALGYTVGLRISEVANLQLKDYDPETGNIKVVKGKGGKSATLRIHNRAKDLLDQWLILRGDQKGSLFLPVLKAGHIRKEAYKVKGKRGKLKPRMSNTAISQMIRKRQLEAGIEPFTYHDLRRSMITILLRKGVPLRTVQRLARHKSPVTTARYDRAELEEALREGERAKW